MRLKGKVFGILASLWAIFIFSNSMKVAEQSEAMSNPIVDTIAGWLSKIGLVVDVDSLSFVIRKTAHFTEYAILGVLITLIFVGMSKRLSFYWSQILFFCLASGLIDETIQTFVAGRSGEVRDVLIDFAGGVLGFLTVWMITSIKQKNQRSFRYKKGYKY